MGIEFNFNSIKNKTKKVKKYSDEEYKRYRQSVDKNIIPKIKTNDIISKIIGTADEKCIMIDIIESMDLMISAEIRNDKVVQLPYMGSIEPSIFQKKFKERSASHKILKERLSEEEYSETIKDEIKEIREEIKEKKIRDKRYENIKRKNIKKYTELSQTKGKAFADLYILTRLEVTPIEFDEHLNNLILGINDE